MGKQLTDLCNISEKLSDGVLLIAATGELLYLNRVALNYFGCEMEEAVGSALDKLVEGKRRGKEVLKESFSLLTSLLKKEAAGELNCSEFPPRKLSPYINVSKISQEEGALFFVVFKPSEEWPSSDSCYLSSLVLLESVANSAYAFIRESSMTSLTSIIERLLRDISTVIDSTGAFVVKYLPSSEGDDFFPIASTHEEWIDGIDLLFTDCPSDNEALAVVKPMIEEVIALKRSVVKNNLFLGSGTTLHSFLVVPLLNRHELIGIATFLSDKSCFLPKTLQILLPVLQIMIIQIIASESQEKSEQYKRELFQSVNELKLQNTLLEEAREQAHQASIAKSSFLANISHEIRTPLNAIVGMSELLQHTELTSKQEKYINTILSSSETLLQLINELLDISKIEAGKLSFEMIEVDLVEVIQSAVELIASRAAMKKIDLLLDIDPALPEIVVIDPLRLKQILLNLLSNAVKFTEAGYVRLSVEERAIGEERVEIAFSVEDSGIGIAEEALSKLFMTFTQADSSTTRRYGGSGLGLVISKQLVEMFGGKIDVTSKEGVGSLFHFVISASYKRRAKEPEGDELLRGARLFYIEGREEEDKTLLSYFEEWGISPITCKSAAEAILLQSRLSKGELSAIFDNSLSDGKIVSFTPNESQPISYIKVVDQFHEGSREPQNEVSTLAKPIYPSQLKSILLNKLTSNPSMVGNR